MNNLLLYLLKVSAVTTLFYLCYLLLFCKDTFYLRNRIFLILILILPTIIPIIKVPILSYSAGPLQTTRVIDNFIISDTTSETTITNTINSFNYNRLFVWIYFIITGLLLLKGAISLITTFRITKKGTVVSNQFPKVIISDLQHPPFSFFSYVVIPAEDYNSGNYIDVLNHEFAHIKQGHTFDLLLCELFIAFQWFNPFIWLIKRSILLNHEYLADHASLINNNAREYQFNLLKFQVGLKNVSLAHNFNSLIKNRIIMINKKPTCKYATLKNIVILPVVALVAYAFATPEYKYIAPVSGPLSNNQATEVQQNEVKGIVLGEDGKPLMLVTIIVAFPGDTPTNIGVQSGANGRFELKNIQKETSLLISGIGYKSQTLKPDFTSEMIITMEKDPNYKGGVMTPDARYIHEGEYVTIKVTDDTMSQALLVIDGNLTNYKGAVKLKRDDIGTGKILKGKEAIDKYGEKGKYGVIEIVTKKWAAELGLDTSPPASKLKQRDPYDIIPFRNDSPSNINTYFTNGSMEKNSNNLQEIKKLSASDHNDGFLVFDTYIVTLRPGVTMDRYVHFLKTRFVSEYDKNFPGSKLTIVSPDFWMKKNQYSFFYNYESSKEYYKYYPNGAEMSAECKAAWEKMRSVKQEASKYILDSERVENEWEQWMDDLPVD